MNSKPTLFEQLGGLSTLERVHKRFYDAIYAHPWLGRFFESHTQQAIELRQSQFMAEKFGADIRYPGMALELAHRRMFIPEELLQLRQSILRNALQEERIPEALIRRWLKIDHAFWKQIRNDSPDQFNSIDLKYERPFIVENPENI
ncbi:MAG: group 1 truncated hemoglobin [Zetaproteobacteria bacterium CG_4_9_14_3_um_filter_49_83]|nr:MAG: group 1 truncated hemoglobin [Zetaproteobacteria bacterium CG1_02_49_23]PIQ30092.1 MAG: group 1 truncated hemoglobin [Zetaproteobacteria bacterium CG17_big_fil_post_rev_8_21_14_2_50_50_13]PIV31538.1 MAG: group 1 truncated hemoglobin [Zetaproteobacteria bacterium CG02_land_8_20_14_3_00_50_9]PIY55960.1 MAG: group 1 truncated hemoglobin [Zetaproteobacteria bacterium CG_4_10_14_0_8_um_filter_49_80]PJA36364.1 MAG: group 1 truncated hemoglobin [Zetaproteobacteria bacterium CG_4_9_14_3_um_filt